MSDTIYAEINKHSMPSNKANERHIRSYTENYKTLLTEIKEVLNGGTYHIQELEEFRSCWMHMSIRSSWLLC